MYLTIQTQLYRMHIHRCVCHWERIRTEGGERTLSPNHTQIVCSKPIPSSMLTSISFCFGAFTQASKQQLYCMDIMWHSLHRFVNITDKNCNERAEKGGNKE